MASTAAASPGAPPMAGRPGWLFGPAADGMLGCGGSGKAAKLAEIAAATVLAGELSMAGALISGEFAAAHEHYGRNRPPGEVKGGG